MTKLQEINPPTWASATNYANDASGELWATGASPTKVEPPPSVYLEGVRPKATVAAEHENWMRNRQTEQQGGLLLDRLADVRTFREPNIAPDALQWNGAPCYDVDRKLWVACGDSGNYSAISQDGAARRALRNGGLSATSEIGYHAASGKYVQVTATGSWRTLTAATLAAVTSGTLAAAALFRVNTTSRPFDTGAGGPLLFHGQTSAGIQCVHSFNGTAWTLVTLPSAGVSTFSRFWRNDADGRIWLFAINRCWFSTDNGATWTSSGATAVSGVNSIWDPVSGVWRTVVGTLVYESPYATPGSSSTVVKTFSGGRTFDRTIPFGRYAVGVYTTVDFASLPSETTTHIAVSADYGRSWSKAETVNRMSNPAFYTDLDSERASVGVRLNASENGWIAWVDRIAITSTQLYYCRPFSQVDTGF